MKKSFLFVLLLAAVPLLAQRPNISVTPGSETVSKIQRTGLKAFVAFDNNKVGSAWEDYLRKNGKSRVESSRDVYTVETAKIAAISDKPIRIISKVEQDGKGKSYVFAAFDVGSGYITSTDSHYAAAERFMRDFVVKMYKDEYGDQLGDAEKAFLAAQKAQQRLTEKEQDWQKEIQDSNQSIADMQKKIEDRKQKIAELTKQVEDNKINKQKAADETERTRKIFEQMKSKVGDIN